MGLSPSQINQIHKSYDATRLANTKTSQLRYKEIYQQFPRIKEINDIIAVKSLDISKSITKAPKERVALLEKLKTELTTLKSEKIAILTNNGYSADYLDALYDCSDCKDTGLIGGKKCHCYKQAAINLAYEQSNVQSVIAKENFETFRFDVYDHKVLPTLKISPQENAKSVYNYCKKFVETYDSQFNNLILYGQAGLGKTFLCNSIAKALLDRGKVVIYLTAFQLFRLLETYRFHNDEQLVSYDQIDDLYTCDLLIIDDLGSEIINQFTTSELFNCLNTRILRKKSTVISTNLEPSGWSDNYSNRIVSRIFGHYTPLKLVGNDIRLSAYNP